MQIITKMMYRRQGESEPKLEDVVIWVDELPPEYQRGKMTERKNRRFKQENNRRIVEAKLEMGKDYW